MTVILELRMRHSIHRNSTADWWCEIFWDRSDANVSTYSFTGNFFVFCDVIDISSKTDWSHYSVGIRQSLSKTRHWWHHRLRAAMKFFGLSRRIRSGEAWHQHLPAPHASFFLVTRSCWLARRNAAATTWEEVDGSDAQIKRGSVLCSLKPMDFQLSVMCFFLSKIEWRIKITHAYPSNRKVRVEGN